MAHLVGFVFLAVAVILQTTIVRRVTLLYGPADLVLLVLLAWVLHRRTPQTWQWGVVAGLLVGLASNLPWWITAAGYALAVLAAQALQTRVWQVTLLTVFSTALAGTFIVHGLAYLYLFALGTSTSPVQAFNLVLLPAAILNLLLTLPVYAFTGELTKWLTPVTETGL